MFLVITLMRLVLLIKNKNEWGLPLTAVLGGITRGVRMYNAGNGNDAAAAASVKEKEKRKTRFLIFPVEMSALSV